MSCPLSLANVHPIQSTEVEHAALESHAIEQEGTMVVDVQRQFSQRFLLES